MKPDSSNDVDRVHGHIDQRGPQDTDDKGIRHNLSSRRKYIFNAQKCPDARKTPLNVTEALKGLGNTGARKPKVCSRKGTSMHTISR